MLAFLDIKYITILQYENSAGRAREKPISRQMSDLEEHVIIDEKFGV